MTEPEPTTPPFVPYVPGPVPQQHAEPLPPLPAASLPPVSPAPAATGPVLGRGYAPRGNRGWLIAAGVAAAVLLVAAGAVGALLLTSDKSPVDVVKAVAGPKSFRVTGTLTLQDSDGYTGTSTCAGKRGYDDIGQGAQVTVSDAAGATVAIGRLGPGEKQSFGCVFNFSVPDVPAGKSFYGIEVSHRGVLKYTEAEISTANLALTLG